MKKYSNHFGIYQMESCAETDVTKKAQLLIEKKEGQIEVNRDVVEQVSKLKHPLVVVSIIGLYRSGKSHLLNTLGKSETDNTGFPVDSELDPKTKGIWIKVDQEAGYDGSKIVWLDTEGLGGQEEDENWIVSLAIVLSTVLIYNVKGCIDFHSMRHINMFTEIAKNVRGGSDCRKTHEYIPAFIMAVRDFDLQMKVNGKVISMDDYLEHRLKTDATHGTAFKRHYSQRKCFTFPYHKDKEGFEKSWMKLRNYLLRIEVNKDLQQKTANGKVWCDLTEESASRVNSGAINAKQLWSAAERVQTMQVVESSLKVYMKTMEKHPYPGKKDLATRHEAANEEALAHFHKESLFEPTSKTLEDRIGEAYEDVQKRVQIQEAKQQVEYFNGVLKGGTAVAGMVATVAVALI